MCEGDRLAADARASLAEEVERQLARRPRWLTAWAHQVGGPAAPEGDLRPSLREIHRAVRLVADEIAELLRAHPGALDDRPLPVVVEDVLFFLHVRGDLQCWTVGRDGAATGLVPGHTTLLWLVDGALSAAIEELAAGSRRGSRAVARRGAGAGDEGAPAELAAGASAPPPHIRPLATAVDACTEGRRLRVAAAVVEYVAARLRRPVPGATSYLELPPVSYREYTLASDEARSRVGRPFRLFLSGLLRVTRVWRVHDCLPRRVGPPVARRGATTLHAILDGETIEAQLALLAGWIVRGLALPVRSDIPAAEIVMRLAVDLLSEAHRLLAGERPELSALLAERGADQDDGERDAAVAREILRRVAAGQPRRRARHGAAAALRRADPIYERRRSAREALTVRRIRVANRALAESAERARVSHDDLLERARATLAANVANRSDAALVIDLVRALSDESGVDRRSADRLVAIVERLSGRRPGRGQAGRRPLFLQPRRLDLVHAHLVVALRLFAEIHRPSTEADAPGWPGASMNRVCDESSGGGPRRQG